MLTWAGLAAHPTDMSTTIKLITEAEANALGLDNWIGTFGRGKYGIDAKAVKTRKLAEAWIRRLCRNYIVKDGAYVWEQTGWKGEKLGWAAWVS